MALRFDSITFDTSFDDTGDPPEAWILYSTDDASEATPVWNDATPKVRSFATSRGRESELQDVDAGTASVTLDNRARTFDPVINTSIRPMNPWWIRVQHAAETQDIFKGYADSYDQQWPAPVGDAITVVACTDEFKVLALDHLPTMNPPRDSYEDLVMFDNPAGFWRFSDSSLRGTAGPTLAIAPSGSGYSIANVTPIVGDNVGDAGTPGGSLSLASTQTVADALSEGGGACDVTTLIEMGFECWFKTTDATPSSQIHLAYGPSSTFSRQWRLLLNTAGTLSFTLSTGAAETTATSATVLQDNTWYHIFCTVSGGNMRIYINSVQDGTAAWSSAIGPLSPSLAQASVYLGLAGASNMTMGWDEVAFYRNTIPAARVLAHYQAGTQRGFPSQLPGVRVGAVLDAVGSQAPRFIQAGTNTMTGAFMHGQDPLGELRQAEKAESVDAGLFTARDGTITYLADGHRSGSPWNTVQATFDDDGTDLPYLDVDIDYSEAFLANEWNVTRTGGTTQTASDATSIARYFKRPQSLTDLPITLDADATAVASAMVAKYKDPLTRIRSLTLTTHEPAVAEAAFRRDIGDRIQVFRTPPGGGARIDQTLFIQKIEVSGTNDGGPWVIRWGVSPV